MSRTLSFSAKCSRRTLRIWRMVVWGRGIGDSLDRGRSKKRYRCPFTHTNASVPPRSGCPKTPERVSGINRNRCPGTPGIATRGTGTRRASGGSRGSPRQSRTTTGTRPASLGSGVMPAAGCAALRPSPRRYRKLGNLTPAKWIPQLNGVKATQRTGRRHARRGRDLLKQPNVIW